MRPAYIVLAHTLFLALASTRCCVHSPAIPGCVVRYLPATGGRNKRVPLKSAFAMTYDTRPPPTLPAATVSCSHCETSDPKLLPGFRPIATQLSIFGLGPPSSSEWDSWSGCSNESVVLSTEPAESTSCTSHGQTDQHRLFHLPPTPAPALKQALTRLFLELLGCLSFGDQKPYKSTKFN